MCQHATRLCSRSHWAWAEVLNAQDIFIGVNALDYSGYPDCRGEYVKAFQEMANLATKSAVEGHKITVHAPLIDMTKAENHCSWSQAGRALQGNGFMLPSRFKRPCLWSDATLVAYAVTASPLHKFQIPQSTSKHSFSPQVL